MENIGLEPSLYGNEDSIRQPVCLVEAMLHPPLVCSRTHGPTSLITPEKTSGRWDHMGERPGVPNCKKGTRFI